MNPILDRAATALASVTLASFALAQTTPGQAQTPAHAAADWRIPLHTAPTRGPAADDYGIWAAGPDYKASFHDGFAFYPLLGPDRSDHLPLCWHTTSVTVAGEELASPVTGSTHTDWRYEIRRGAVTEVYDVLPDGVEQSFVLYDRPVRSGDLVVTGTITTPLHAKPRAATHGPLVFRDALGEPIIRYGAAWAIDATGEKTEVGTSFDGECVRLHVDATWLDRAAYPVTVDPLTSGLVLFVGGGTMVDTDVVTTSGVNDPQSILAVHSRVFTSNDVDAYGTMVSDRWTNVRTIWSEVSISSSTRRPRCCYVDPEFVIAFERGASVGTYTHDRRIATTNGGVTRLLTPPLGQVYRRPDIGGTRGLPPSSVMVYERSGILGQSPPTEVSGVFFSTTSHQFGTPFLLSSFPIGSFLTRTKPTISTSNSGTHWLVAWQERSTRSATDDWDVVVNLLHFQGGRGNPTVMGPFADVNKHTTDPVVDGDSGRWLVAFTVTDSSRRSVVAQRLDWANTGGAATRGPEQQFAFTLAINPLVVRGLAFDRDTRWHWSAVHQRNRTLIVTRFGRTGGVVETQNVSTISAGVGGVAYWGERGTRAGRFVVTYRFGDTIPQLAARHFEYPVGAGASAFGSGCGVSLTYSSLARPYAGGVVGLSFVGGAPNRPTFLFAGVTEVSLPLPGAPGCLFLLDPATSFVAIAGTTDAGGRERFSLPLPDAPVFIGDVRFQGIHLDPNANSLGAVTSNGILLRVR